MAVLTAKSEPLCATCPSGIRCLIRCRKTSDRHRNRGTRPYGDDCRHCPAAHAQPYPAQIESSAWTYTISIHHGQPTGQAAGGIPFNACEFQSKGDAITDLHDMAADGGCRSDKGPQPGSSPDSPARPPSGNHPCQMQKG